MDSDNLGPAVLAVAWTLAAVATLVVAARLYVRLRIVRTLNADDYIILLTLVCLPSLCDPIIASACPIQPTAD